MKNLCFNKLLKNKDFKTNINQKNKAFPLKDYITNGNRLNSFTYKNKIEVNRSAYNNQTTHKVSSNLITSYTHSGNYFINTQNQNKTKTKHNNHSLFDSNKRQIISTDFKNKYIRFEPKNVSNIKEKDNNKNKSTNISIYNSNNSKANNNNITKNYRLKNNDNNARNYSYQKNYFNNNITNINYNINIQNFSVKGYKNINSSSNSLNYSTKKINNKYINNSKNSFIQRNIISNLKNNYHYTEIYDTKNNQSQKIIKNRKQYSIAKNLSKSKEKDRNKDSRSPSIIKTELYNTKKEKNYIINKRNDNINTNYNKRNSNTVYNYNTEFQYKVNIPIKLNIENINKEKLSRIKKIIENSSSNFNYYKKEKE